MPPTFSPELDELFFTKCPTEDGFDNKIYHSIMVDKIWQQPTLATFSSNAMEFEAQFSCDGKTLFYGHESLLYYSERTKSGWSGAKLS